MDDPSKKRRLPFVGPRFIGCAAERAFPSSFRPICAPRSKAARATLERPAFCQRRSLDVALLSTLCRGRTHDKVPTHRRLTVCALFIRYAHTHMLAPKDFLMTPRLKLVSVDPKSAQLRKDAQSGVHRTESCGPAST